MRVARTTMATASGTRMTDSAALYRLLTWLSPAYPIGGFSYSHGLETAVEEGLVRNRADLAGYIAMVLQHGAGRVDAALLAESWRAAAAEDDTALDEVAVLAAAWRGTAETALETTQQGGSFARVTIAAWPDERYAAFAQRHNGRLTHPVAFGAAAAWQGVALDAALLGWLASFGANLVSAGVRLIPLGQTDGQLATAALQPMVEACAAAAPHAALDGMGTAAPMLDLLSMRHETQYTRLFRS